jgi:hypothetical protein
VAHIVTFEGEAAAELERGGDRRRLGVADAVLPAERDEVGCRQAS